MIRTLQPAARSRGTQPGVERSDGSIDQRCVAGNRLLPFAIWDDRIIRWEGIVFGASACSGDAPVIGVDIQSLSPGEAHEGHSHLGR